LFRYDDNTRRHVLKRVELALVEWVAVGFIATVAFITAVVFPGMAIAAGTHHTDDMIISADDHYIMSSEPDTGISITGILGPNILTALTVTGVPTAGVSDNIIIVDANLNYTLVGGFTNLEGVNGNTLEIGYNLVASALGGRSEDATGNFAVSGNTINFSGTSVGGRLVGGAIILGTLNSNEVNINLSSSTTANMYITGGISEGGVLTNNKVTISGDGSFTANEFITGGSTEGLSTPSSLTGNSVTVNAGTGSVNIVNYVAGAFVSGSGISISHSISNNTVTLERGTYDNFVAGAFGSVGNGSTTMVSGATFTSNKVEIKGDVSVGTMIYGAATSASLPNTNIFVKNSVIVSDEGLSTGLNLDVVEFISGAHGHGGVAEENEVKILTKGTVHVIEDVMGASLEAGSRVEGNIVDIATVDTGQVTIDVNVIGGTSNWNNVDSEVKGNIVKLKGAVQVGGGIYGGQASNGKADGNTVDFDGLDPGNAYINGSAYGGYVATGNADGSASNNSLRLGNVKLTGGSTTRIAAGWVNGGTLAKAENNTLELFGMIDLGNNIALVGGGGGGVAIADGFKGNTLRMSHVEYDSNKIFANVYGFDKLIFDVNDAEMAAAVNATTALLQATSINLSDGADTNSSIVLNVTDGSSATGKTVAIIGSSAITVSSTPLTVGLAVDGLLERDIALSPITNGIQGTMGAGRPRDEAKALSELPLADISFVNRGSDFIASRAIPVALASVSGAVGVAAFATLGYGWERTETGSHVDVKGFSGDIGLAVGTDTSVGPFVAGAFLEFGDGTYDSYNQFSGIANSVHGEGDLSYIGGGVFARLDFGQSDSSRPYFEASVRFGKTDADFRTSDFTAALGTEVNYDFDAKYWGFHAGGGYIINFAGFDGSLDLSAKYFHTHRDGDDFIAFNQRVELSSVTSSRMRVGGRLNAGLTPTIKGYFGLYFEHEFDGDSNVSYAGYALPEASLGGSSGVGELGLIVSSPSSPLEVQLGVEGSAGRRDAISANLGLRFTF
jgi:hypothetical protein